MNTTTTIPPIFSIDIGNSRTKLGLVDCNRLTCSVRTAVATEELSSGLLPAISKLVASAADRPSIALSGVVQQVTDRTEQVLRDNGFSVKRLTPTSPFPLSIDYENIQELGTDRIANALFAVNRFPGESAIIISTGTAITVDLISGNTFHGGAILPGLSLQLQSLQSGTDALPIIEVDQVSLPHLPAKSTRSCILGGVIYGTATAISGIVDRYQNQMGKQLHIFATGGDWPRLSPLVDFRHQTYADLTLIGLATLYCI